jgi:5-methylthioadenosine/S-adenosylhomocysteine deaminase
MDASPQQPPEEETMPGRAAITRRDFLAGAAALGALGAAGCASPAGRSGAGGPPEQGEYLIRDAHVMTMDPAAGDLPGARVHVRRGEIVAVGAHVEAPAAQVIDARGMIVLPGLVETHWHMWNSLLRSMSGDRREHGYFPTALALGKAYLPSDMYQGTRLAAAEALNGGITFVHDWCHNIRAPEFADAGLRALGESGLRARFSYGAAQGQPGDQPIDLADLERRSRGWERYSNGGLISLGLAWRGPSTGATGAVAASAYRRDFDAARALGLPISVHANNRKGSDAIALLAREKFLGRDVQVIHATWVSPEEIRALADSGSGVSLSPYTELRIGFGFPPTGELLAAGIPVGLSVDTTALSGNADMFAIMKANQNIDNARAQNEFKLPARRVLELATIEGARSMGMAGRIGSLAPGKRADLIMVNARDVNLGVWSDPAHMLVEAAQPANVDTVMVDGRILKRRGRLTSLDVEQTVAEASQALAAVRKRAGWW